MKASRRVGLIVGLIMAMYVAIALTVFPVFPHFVSPNEFSRWLLGASLVEHHTVEVTALAPMFGPRFEDLSERDGRLYSNKAPGAALVGLPGYAAVRLFTGPPAPGNLRLSLTAMRLVASTLPLAGLVGMMILLARRQEEARTGASFGVFALLFATPLFSYGLIFFAHALSAAAVFAGWALLFGWGSGSRVADSQTAESNPGTRGIRDGKAFFEVAAGAAVGLAIISEYPLAVVALVCIVVLLWEKRFAGLLRFLAGMAPLALILAIYNTMAFGGPLRLSSAYERLAEFRALADTGLFGVGIPSPLAATEMLFGPQKGLFLFSPILLLGIRALPAAKRLFAASAFWAFIAIPAAILLIYSGYPNWHGGWSVGPRYLAAIIPFLIFPLFLRPPGRLECIAAGFSAAATVTASLVFPFPPTTFPIAWATFSPALLGRGLVAPNLFHLIAPLPAIAIPMTFCVVALVAATPRDKLTHAALGIGLAITIMVATSFMRTPSLSEKLQIAYIEEVYFEQAGALQVLEIPLPPRLMARRDLELGLPPSSWPLAPESGQSPE